MKDKDIEVIYRITSVITELVKEADIERHNNPHKFKLRNHFISQALGLHTSLVILDAYPEDILDWLKVAIQNYDVYTVQHIANIHPY